MSTETVKLHRVLRCSPDKVYRAFLNPLALAKWFPPHGFFCEVLHFEAQVGGGFRMAFENFTTGHRHAFGGQYQTLTPDELIQYTDTFDDPNLPGTMQVTVKLQAVSCGTDVHIEQSGIPDIIPVEACYLGWQESLVQLAQLVEPDIPD